MQDRHVEVFNNAVKKNFVFLKNTSNYDELLVKSIKIKNDLGYLVPICKLHSSDDNLIEKLASWRDKNQFAYPTQFPVTIEGTKSWLTDKLLNIEDRILFLILDRKGHPVGHLGFANSINNDCSMEIDNVIRGESSSEKGLMFYAMQSLISWAEKVISPDKIYLRVLADNEHAISFYKKLCFSEESRIPLKREEKGNTVTYVAMDENDLSPKDNEFIRMDYQPDSSNVGKSLILTAGPSISSFETMYAWDAAKNGWNNHWGDYIKEFEKSFAEYLGVKHALSFSSCTGALHLSLLALGIGPGDEVIVPDITWVASANAILYVGATPIFCDINPKTFCLDPMSVEKCITDKTRAIIPVHLYGHPAPMKQIMDVARKYNLFVVEDAAPSIGAEIDGQKTGTFGDFAAFSFQGAKLVVAGEGGMLVTNNDELYEKVYSIWDQGRQPGTFWIDKNGWKYKMSNVQAAIGLGQLQRVDELIEMKRKVFDWYEEGLSGIQGLELSFEPKGTRSIYWMSNIIVDDTLKISRDELCAELKKRNIDTRNIFPAISQYPIWPKKQSPQPNAKYVGDHGINLPSGVCLSRDEVAYICKSIREIIDA